jgi:hypothetical protein
MPDLRAGSWPTDVDRRASRGAMGARASLVLALAARHGRISAG